MVQHSSQAMEPRVTRVLDTTNLVKSRLVYSSVRQQLRSDRLAHTRRVGRDGCQARRFSPRGIHYCTRYPAKIINELMRGGERESKGEKTHSVSALKFSFSCNLKEKHEVQPHPADSPHRPALLGRKREP